MNEQAAGSTSRRSSLHGHWSSRLAFVMAVTGSAVGLGNIWKFPYVVGEYGGGAFVMVYLVAVFAVGLPIMTSEILLGRRGRRNPIATMRILGEEEGSTRHWQWLGGIGVLAGFLILSFYSVIAGWILSYIVNSFTGAYSGADLERVVSLFETTSSSLTISTIGHTVFMVMTAVVVALGVQHGLERAIRILMPLLMVLLLVLVAYSYIEGDFARAVEFMFTPNFDALTSEAVLVALGQAFFTLSVGMGTVMAYGAYLPEGTPITSSALTVVLADTLIAILAGLVIFPIIFANGLDPASGPGLVFEALPLAFGQMPGGIYFGALFFVLVTFAAWTSSIGLIEPAVAWIVETFYRPRAEAAIIVAFAAWLLGMGTVFSFSIGKDVVFWQGTIFDNVEYLSTNILLPIGGLLITVFAGWVLCRNSSSEELGVGTGFIYRGWRFMARFVAPAAVVLVFLHATGLIKL
jgi:NSS family neurotransmitter:Na+ symporter